LDLTVGAIPAYFGSMRAEYLALRTRAATQGPSPADYERRDTIASLSMGVGSLLAPIVIPRLLKPFTPGTGKYGKALIATAVGAIAVTTLADVVVRRAEARNGVDDPNRPDNGNDQSTPNSRSHPDQRSHAHRSEPARSARIARRVASAGSVAAVVAGGLAVTTTWASRTSPARLWDRRITRDRGTGPLAVLGAVLAWDFLYYWNHRLQHESRYMWAIHVVHHSSEHYNLSTALRQPVGEAFGTFVPFSALCLLGFRPEVVETARGVNLLYQYWIHTDTIRRIGPAERVLNTPSHHRAHHGSNRQYLDRNHGSILIVWDKLFGTFEPEGEPVVYGLTTNIDTFAPARIATHEHADMLRDVAQSRSWRERLSYVVRGPGWAIEHRKPRAVA
jgi:sterol desaturase/sphingolipid hydroxylase (fatty acid hydroxylase superfamily)